LKGHHYASDTLKQPGRISYCRIGNGGIHSLNIEW